MMIKKTTPLSMAESEVYIKDDEVKSFFKKFTKLDSKKGKEIRERLTTLNLIKLNEKHISKLIDFMPDSKEEVIRILPDSNLDENETNAILSAIKESK